MCAAEGGRGGAWSRDNVIVFGGNRGVLSRVPAAGGESTELTALEAGHLDHRFPSFMPDGSQVLLFVQSSAADRGLYAASMLTGQIRKLASADTGGIYSRGHLLFARGGTLLAQRFDADSLVAAGDPFPVAERVETGVFAGMLGFSASETGVLTYGTGDARVGDGIAQVVVVDRQGKLLETLGAGSYIGVDLSPDGAQLVAHRHEGGAPAAGGGGDLWLLGLQRGTTMRFTFDGEENAYPIWSPDGQRIAFSTRHGGKPGIAQKLASGAGEEERLLDLPAHLPGASLSSWSPDGQALLYMVSEAKTGTDVWLLPLAGDRKPRPLLNMSFNESHAVISPDGKWVAYQSNETGRMEVYVRPFPSGPGKWQVSNVAAIRPRWRGDGKELFLQLVGSGGVIAAVDVTVCGARPQFGAIKELFPANSSGTHLGHHAYAVSRDGQRLILPRARHRGGRGGGSAHCSRDELEPRVEAARAHALTSTREKE